MTSITKNEILALAELHPVISECASECQSQPDATLAVELLAENERESIGQAMAVLSGVGRLKSVSGAGTYSLKHALERQLPCGYISHPAFLTALLASGFKVAPGPGFPFGKYLTNLPKAETNRWYQRKV